MIELEHPCSKHGIIKTEISFDDICKLISGKYGNIREENAYRYAGNEKEVFK